MLLMCDWPDLFDAYWFVHWLICYGFMRKVVGFRFVVIFICSHSILCMMRFSKNLGNQDYSRLSLLILA